MENRSSLDFVSFFKNNFVKLYLKYSDKIPKLIREVGLTDYEDRDIKYEENSYGITEILSCPKKAKLRRAGIEVPIEKFEIADGFIFEFLVKALFLKMFGREKIEFEKDLIYPVESIKIHGHLDVFVNLSENEKVGVEIKNTVLQFDNKTFKEPEPLIVLSERNKEDLKRININPKYLLQAKIQKFILERLYPDSNIRQFLLIKTNLKTKWKFGKSLILFEVVNPIEEDRLKRIVKRFLEVEKPRAVWECKICPYKLYGHCDGFEIDEIIEDDSLVLEELEEINKEVIEELVARRDELVKELKTIEDEIKKRVKGKLKIGNKEIGWVEEIKYEWNPKVVNKILKEKGIKDRDKFFQLKPSKIKELEKILGSDIKRARQEKVVKKFKL